MSEIRDKVKTRILEIITDRYWGSWLSAVNPTLRDITGCWTEAQSVVELILSIPELAIVDREVELPGFWMGEEMPYGMRSMMRETGRVKEVKEVIDD